MKSELVPYNLILKKLSVILFTILILTSAKADVLIVPDEYPTVQSAVEAAQEGDTVMLQPGRYYENVTIDNKGITLTSYYEMLDDKSIRDRTIIDGMQSGLPLLIKDVDSEVVMKGLIITNGLSQIAGGIKSYYSKVIFEDILVINNSTTNVMWCGGGGIYAGASDIVLRNSEIRNNSAYDFGGGINIRINSTARLENVRVQNNEVSGGAHSKGGGIHIDESSGIIISNCEITGNNAYKWGGGLAFGAGAGVTILNTTIAYNSANNGGGGMYFNYDNISVKVGNVISYNNTPQEIFFDDICFNDTITLFYSDIAGGEQGIYNSGFNEVQWMEGNITAYPQFVDPGNGDYSLFETSPCIDAGAALFVYNGDTLINLGPDEYIGFAPDMGCHEYDPSVGMDDFPDRSEKGIFIYPNPACNRINLDIENTDFPLEMKILAHDGKVVLRQILTSERAWVDVSRLEAGLYLISIKGSEYELIQKVIISR